MLSLNRPASSLLLALLSALFRPPSSSPVFFSIRGEWFECRGEEGGGGKAGGLPIPGALRGISLSACKRCIVSLLHSFLILRSACVANPQKLFDPSPCLLSSPKYFALFVASRHCSCLVLFLFLRCSSFDSTSPPPPLGTCDELSLHHLHRTLQLEYFYLAFLKVKIEE